MLSSAGSRLCALILVLASLALAASPTSFCKCTCFGSYKIIPLDAPADASDPTSGGNSGGSTGSSSSSSSPNLRSSRSLSDLLLRRNSNSDKLDTRSPLTTRQDSNDSSPDSSSPDSSNSDSNSSPNPNRKEYRTKTCNDCNRSFCLEQNLPECRDAEDKDVFATCFQRDSSKDQAVVYLFLATTVSLLGWAVAKPCLGAIGNSRRMGMGSGGGVAGGGGAGWLSSLGRGRRRSGTGNGQMYMPVTEQDR